MRVSNALALAVTLAAPGLLPVSRAAAQPVTYTFTITGDGTLGATPFTGQTVTFTAAGDLSGVSAPGSNPAVATGLGATTSVPTLGGFALTSPIYVFNASPPTFGVAGFGVVSDYLQVWSAALQGYDLRSSIGPVSASVVCPDATGALLPCIGGNVNLGDAIATSGGDLRFSAVRGASFAAQVGVVPEPSTVALLGGGLVALGAAARRRRPVSAP